MEDYISNVYFMNTPTQWLLAFAFIFGGVIIAKIAYFIFKRIAKKFTINTKTRLDDVLVDTLEKPIIFAITILGFYLGMRQLEMTPYVASIVLSTDKVLIVVCITCL